MCIRDSNLYWDPIVKYHESYDAGTLALKASALHECAGCGGSCPHVESKRTPNAVAPRVALAIRVVDTAGCYCVGLALRLNVWAAAAASGALVERRGLERQCAGVVALVVLDDRVPVKVVRLGGLDEASRGTGARVFRRRVLGRRAPARAAQAVLCASLCAGV